MEVLRRRKRKLATKFHRKRKKPDPDQNTSLEVSEEDIQTDSGLETPSTPTGSRRFVRALINKRDYLRAQVRHFQRNFSGFRFIRRKVAARDEARTSSHCLEEGADGFVTGSSILQDGCIADKMAVKPDKSQPEESEDLQAKGMDGTGAAVRHSGSSGQMDYTSRSGRVGSELKNWADLMNSLSPKGCSGEQRHEDSLPEMTKADDDAFIDDLPLGSEANTISPGPVTSCSSTSARPQDARLASLKATGNIGWTSFNSEISNQTSGSSATELDILLSQRGVDPEQMLRSLGFGYVGEEEPGMLRVPARFMQKSHANGINIEEFLEEYPELQRMLKKSSVAAGWRQISKSLSTVGAMKSVLGGLNRTPQNTSSPVPLPEPEALQPPKPHSILIPENREALARQGFYDYGSEGFVKGRDASFSKSSQETAAVKRRQFQKTKTTKRYSLIDSDDEEPWGTKSLDESRGRTSTTDFSSSMDSSDSPANDSRSSSISEKRRLYEEEFMKNAQSFLPGGLSNRRQQMVRRLTSDEDCEITPLPSKQNTVEKCPTLTDEEEKSDVSGKSVVIVVSETDPLRQTKLSPETSPLSQPKQTLLNIVSLQTERLSDSGSECATLVGSPRPSEADITHPALSTMLSKDSVFENESDRTDGQVSITCQTSLESAKLDENENVSATVEDKSTKRRLSQDDLPRMASVQSDSSGFGDADNPGDFSGLDHDRLQVSSLGSSSESAGTLASSNTTVVMQRDVRDSSTQTASPDHSTTASRKLASSEVQHKSSADSVGMDKDSTESANKTSRFVSTVYIPPVKRTPQSSIVKQNSGATISGKDFVLGKTRVSLTVPGQIQTQFSQLKTLEKSRVSSVFMKRGGVSTSDIVPRAPLAQPEEFDCDETRRKKSYLPSRPPLRASSSLEERPLTEVSVLNLSVSKKESGSRISLADDSDYSCSSIADSTASCASSDIMDYRKLVRLINQPTSYRGRKRCIFRYRPKRQIRDWPNLQRKRRLQEETRLLQHALQKYKTELQTLETACVLQYQLAYEDLVDEEREEVEDLQNLWREIRSQMQDIEQQLAQRMKAVAKGNDFFTILSSLNVIHSMGELLKEQMYHETVSANLEEQNEEDGEDEDVDVPARTSSTLSSPSPSRLVHRSGYGSPFGTPTELRQYGDFHHSMEEMRQSIFEEMKHELNRSTQQLHTGLQEIQRQNLELRIKSARSSRRSRSSNNTPHRPLSRQTDV